MTFRLAYNTTDAPVVVDPAGRMLGGHEWGPARSTSDEAKSALRAGRLVWVELDDDASPAPEVAAAIARVDELNSRTEAFGSLEPADLEQLAAGAELELGGRTTKTQLVELLTYSDVAPPAPAKSTSAKETRA